MGFSGRREATTAPTVVNVKASKARRTIVARLGKIRAEALKNPSTPPPKAANGKEIAHIDHAIHVAVRTFILPTLRPCAFVPSVTTPLYSTTVSKALRQPLRRRRSSANFRECPECELRLSRFLRTSPITISANFAKTEFYEVRLSGVLRTSPFR